MKFCYFDPPCKLHVSWCTQELFFRVLSWATLYSPCIHPLCGTVSMAWVTVTMWWDEGLHLPVTPTRFSHWIHHNRGWMHCHNAPILAGETSVRVGKDTLLPARTVILLSWICLNLLLFPFLHSRLVPYRAVIWKPCVYSSVLQSRWFTYSSLWFYLPSAEKSKSA